MTTTQIVLEVCGVFFILVLIIGLLAATKDFMGACTRMIKGFLEWALNLWETRSERRKLIREAQLALLLQRAKHAQSDVAFTTQHVHAERVA